MKLSEVIEQLENGSTKTYEAFYESGTRVTMSRKGGFPDFLKYNHEGIAYEQQSNAGCFSRNCSLKMDWRPVKTPVKWDMAIREWANGKVIYCEIGGCKFASNDKEYAVTPRMIQLGEWYVEEDDQ